MMQGFLINSPDGNESRQAEIRQMQQDLIDTVGLDNGLICLEPTPQSKNDG